LSRDFTIEIYKELLEAFISEGYTFQTYRDFILAPAEKVVILRHDVDDKKLHSLKFAQIQSQLGIKATYYFRIVPESFDPAIMKDIEFMGHEVGLHYEEMDFARGDREKAYQMFLNHLKTFRAIVDVKTICMHGSPKSKFDNKDIWKGNDYRTLDLIGEPYFDLNVNEVYYLTDTGMMWDGHRYSIRDRMGNGGHQLSFHSTQQIIQSLRTGNFPKKCMMNFHPQRWHENSFHWFVEKLGQSAKNVVKRILLFYRNLR
jgi:hypothetical protein